MLKDLKSELGQKRQFDPLPGALRSAPTNGHRQTASACLKGANKRLMHCSKYDAPRPRGRAASA
jgi:hypothetical protein